MKIWVHLHIQWKWRGWWSFLLGRKIGGLVSLKPRANGRNIIGQQIPTIVGCYMLCPFTHPVLCCFVLLGVVAQRWRLKPVKRLATYACKRTQQLLTLFAPGQQCWELLRPFACSFRVLILRMTAIQFLQYRIKGPGRCQAENRQGFSGYSLDLLVPLRSEI